MNKVCAKCGSPKPLIEFYRTDAKTKEGYRNVCKECIRKRNLNIYNAKRGHSEEYLNQSYLQKAEKRFWAKVEKRGPDDCWEWSGARHPDGYGQFGYLGTVIHASRFSWVLEHGYFPDGLVVCHRCDNPPCVNPKHLFVGNDKDNRHDCILKGRNGRAKLTKEDVIEIRKKLNDGSATKEELSGLYGVNTRTISRILTGERWSLIGAAQEGDMK